MEMRPLCRLALIGACTLFVASPALADKPTPTTTTKKPVKKEEGFKKPSSAQPEVSPAQREEAEKRYARAIELFNEGSYDASLLEFRRAYQLAPSYKILYNVALVNVQLNDYAQALEYFERYLNEGGEDVPELRREEIKQQIDKLTSRVALVTIKSNVTKASVSIDDLETAPTVSSTPLRVNAGRRKITLVAKGYLPATQMVELAGRDTVTLRFELRTPQQARGEGAGGPPERRVPWEAWVGTGILAAGTAVTGVLALRANSDLKEEKDSFDPQDPEAEKKRLEDLESKQKTYALVTDVLAGATLVLGGVALYLTLKQPSSREGKQQGAKNTLQVGVSGRGMAVRGSF